MQWLRASVVCCGRSRVRTVMRSLSQGPLLLLLLLLLLVHGARAVLQQKLYGLPTGLAYYVEVSVGSPVYSNSTTTTTTTTTAQNTFHLLVDTGSANTAVATAECCSATSTTLFSCAASSTCQDQSKEVSVSYLSGAWSGELVADTFSSAELGVVPHLPFVAIHEEANFIQPGYNGIIGLAFPSIGSPQGDVPTPYFEFLQRAHELPNVFSVLLCGAVQGLTVSNGESSTETDNLHAGELLLGGTTGANGERYFQRELVYSPMVQAQWYNVVVTQLSVAGKRVAIGCQEINTPRSIIDSGSSNIALPSNVYTAVVKELQAQVEALLPGMGGSFFSDQVPCCSSMCNPMNADSPIRSLPSLSVALALSDGGDSDQEITVTIPPEYIWRPVVLTGPFGVRACRVFGISEGDITLLGDVFMDGLFTTHDRDDLVVGLGVAQSCPNGVTSTKTIHVVASDISFCDCVSSSDRKSTLLSAWTPFSSKPCFYWHWWMYVMIAAVVVILLSGGVIAWIYWRRRQLHRELEQLSSDRRATTRALQRNLLTPACDAVVAPSSSPPPPPLRPQPAMGVGGHHA